MSRLARICLVAALMVSIGAQWAVMQSAAWLGMAVSYTLESGSLGEGLSRTFDGEHPCPRCKAIQKEQDSEKKSESKAASKLKLELFVVHRLIQFLPPVPAATPEAVRENPALRPAAPPFRPPRSGMI